jgi:fatty acid desaturase
VRALLSSESIDHDLEVVMTVAPAPATRPDSRSRRPSRRTPRSVIVSAWAVPVLVIGQFAMVAIVPVALVMLGTLRDARLRALRWWAVALAAAYATPLVLWAVGPDRAPSLSKDMNPVLAAVVVVAAVAFAVAFHVLRRRGRTPDRDA